MDLECCRGIFFRSSPGDRCLRLDFPKERKIVIGSRIKNKDGHIYICFYNNIEKYQFIVQSPYLIKISKPGIISLYQKRNIVSEILPLKVTSCRCSASLFLQILIHVARGEGVVYTF